MSHEHDEISEEAEAARKLYIYLRQVALARDLFEDDMHNRPLERLEWFHK